MKTTTLLFTFLASASVSFAQVNSLPSSGKVGIGTISPNEALEVNGNMAVDSSMIIKDTLVVEDDARIMNDMRVDGATEMNDVIINGTLWMPNLLNVDSSDFEILVAGSDGTIYGTGPGGLFPVPNQPGGLCDLQGNTYANSPYWVSEPEKLYTACPDVFVGIGMEDPRVNLDVNGTSFSQDLALSTDPLNMGGARLKIGGYDPQNNTNLVRIYNTSDEIFNITNQGTLNLRGKMVMNSDEPSPLVISNASGKILQLNNDGMLRARSVKLDVDVWPDYVFEEDYELRSLEEIKAYIDENGHLPDVPSADVVEEEGMNVGEMNKILLQKLEELTLLVIEQDEKIQQLEQRISE